ncbi:uncharacterized protein LOC134796346 [Cydia splendana]|uniref:uncharacterized protein LOC134796346 n=1 Tax=Cydia splendana TaxID=1100963 RepID=UPI0028F49C63
MAQGVSEHVRGFSFMPENKVDVIDLQYIEGGELSRAWKMSRRERLKNIEAKIWDEFINERDVVESVKSEDPYQFLEELPEGCVREILDAELTKMKEEIAEEVPVEQPKEQTYKEDLQDPRETMVTFAESMEDEQCEIITILDEGEVEEDGSEPCEREELNETMDSQCTVREKPSTPELSVKASEKSREKSPDNVTNIIENGIYSAKVKELQSKVNLELLSVITTLEAHNVYQLDPNTLLKLKRQCSEFCARYCRIYLYPISRQIHDVTRHNNTATPYARHTHTRSQLIRSVSLQQNMLQALQMIHKWFTQKTPLRECVYTIKNFMQLVREADSVCPAEVHNEELLQTCESLDKALGLYLVRLNNFVGDDSETVASVPRSGKSHKSSKCNKHGKAKTVADAKLSMYSLDRFPRSSKASIARSSAGTSKARVGEPPTARPKNPNPLENQNAAANKKTRSRRPLMRAPGGGHRRDTRDPHEHDNITTLVETVDFMATPHASAANSVHGVPRSTSPRSPRRSKTSHVSRSARGIRKSKETSPRSPRLNPKRKKDTLEKDLKLALDAIHASDDTLPSVIKVQCAKKDVVKTPSEATPRTPRTDRVAEEKKELKDDKEVSSTSDVSVLLRQLCAGRSNSKLRSPRERAFGSKNAQLLCVNGGSPRSPSLGTPQLLRILEETIQKQAPKPQFSTKAPVKDLDRYRLSFNWSSSATDALFQYRTKFVQHMLSSPMYANSRVGKPWEMIGKISEQIMDEILMSCAKEMQLEDIIEELYKNETQ